MTEEFPYATAASFRAAIKDRFDRVARTDPRYTVAELQRQFAYDRVLSRCFTSEDAQRWILKGAGALLARLPVARHSRDIDLYYAETAGAPDEAIDALSRHLDRDLGDHFRFEITKITPLQETAKGRRVHLSAYLGVLYANFHVDVVVDTALSGAPDSVPPLTPIVVEGLTRPCRPRSPPRTCRRGAPASSRPWPPPTPRRSPTSTQWTWSAAS